MPSTKLASYIRFGGGMMSRALTVLETVRFGYAIVDDVHTLMERLAFSSPAEIIKVDSFALNRAGLRGMSLNAEGDLVLYYEYKEGGDLSRAEVVIDDTGYALCYTYTPIVMGYARLDPFWFFSINPGRPQPLEWKRSACTLDFVLGSGLQDGQDVLRAHLLHLLNF